MPLFATQLPFGNCVAYFFARRYEMNETFMKEKPVFPLIMSMALPMVISMLVNSLYNIVDSFFVAQISEDAMTALSLVYPVQNFVNAIAIGFGVGISSQISLHLGAGHRRSADMAATQGTALSVIHGLVMTVISISIMPSFLRLFTSDSRVIQLGLKYSVIVFCFSVIVGLNLAFEKLFQAVGRMKSSMMGMISGCIANIILDPLLIFGIGPFPAMGMEGAALATGLGQALNLVIYLIVYHTMPTQVRLRKSCLKPDLSMNKKLYSVGIPAILNLALPSLLISVLNSILAVYSQSYVVILGIYYKLQTFLYLPASGIVQGMRPVMGYNYGAGEQKRVRKIYMVTLTMTCVIMVLGTVVCLAVPGSLMGMFTSNADTILAGKSALRIISIGFIVSSLSVTACGALEGLGKGTPSLLISLCRYVLIIIPAAFLLSKSFGPSGVWHAFWIAEAVTALVSFMISKKEVLQKKTTL